MKPLNSSRLCFGAVLLSVIILMQAVPPVLCRHHVNCQVCSCRDDYIICTKEHSIISTLTTAAASSDVAVAVVAESYYANVSSLIIVNQEHFTYLDSTVMHRFTSLNQLTIVNCGLVFISEHAFDFNLHLTKVDLRNNKLTVVPWKVFGLLTKPLLNFDGNPLSCVCRNKWIQETISYQKDENFFASFDKRYWPTISTLYDDLSELTCYDLSQNHRQPHSLMAYNFGVDCGVPLIVFNETQEFIKKNENESFSVVCGARGQPTPSVEWTISNLTSNVNRIKSEDAGPTWENLVLHQVKGEDTGNMLTCTAENIVGKVSKYIILLVNTRPKIVKLEIRLQDFEFFSLYYEIGGYPLPINRTWLFNGDVLDLVNVESIEMVSSDSIIKGSLTLKRTDDDSRLGREGVYTLIVSNINGKTNSSISVRFDTGHQQQHQTKLPAMNSNDNRQPTYFIPGLYKIQPVVFNENTLTLIVIVAAIISGLLVFGMLLVTIYWLLQGESCCCSDINRRETDDDAVTVAHPAVANAIPMSTFNLSQMTNSAAEEIDEDPPVASTSRAAAIIRPLRPITIENLSPRFETCELQPLQMKMTRLFSNKDEEEESIDEIVSKYPVFPSSCLRPLKYLSEGLFDRVYLAEYRPSLNYTDDVVTQVAVKVLKITSQDSIENFDFETKLLRSMTHSNIITFIGACIDECPRKMVFEFMERGDLNQYLRMNGPQSQIAAILLSTSVDDDSSESSSTGHLNLPVLLKMAIDISSGMEYLASNHYIHRDMATRNCLVGKDLTVKIADFGMSGDAYFKDYYHMEGAGAFLPVRWMSPESLMSKKFTVESDVWSFGVVLWEIFSFGKQPWYSYSNNEVVRKITVDHDLLEGPYGCPREVYQLMLACWKTEPSRRLTIKNVKKCLVEFFHSSLLAD